MRKKCVIGILAIFGIVTAAAGTGFGQSSRCVVLEKQGNMALVSCDGKPARYIDLRGRADIYNVGDSIDPSKISLPGNTERGVKQK